MYFVFNVSCLILCVFSIKFIYFEFYFTVNVLINARIKCALNSENGHLHVN